MLKKIFVHSSLYTLASQTPLVANIFLLPFINQYLSTEDYAIYGLTLGYSGLLTGVGELGSLVLLQNAYFKDRENYRLTWEKYLGFLHMYRVIFGLAMLLLLWLVFKGRIDEGRMTLFLFLTVVPIAFFDFTKTVGVRFCQWREQHSLVYLGTLISSLLTVSLTFYTIYFLKMGFFGWFVSAFFSKLFDFFYYGYLIYIVDKIRPHFRVDFRFIGQRLRVALPFIPTKYANYLINNSDRVVLDIFRARGGAVTLSQIGLYNIAYSFANYFTLFNNSVNSVVSPLYFKLFAEENVNAAKMIRNLTMLWFYFVLISGLMLCLWLKEIMMYLYPKPEFATAYQYSVLIIMSLCYRPFMVATIDRAIYNEKTGTIMKITLMAGLLNVGMNLVAIPLWGVPGAVVSSFITYLYLGFSGFFLKEVKKYILESYKPVQILLLLIGLSGLAFYMKDLFWTYKVGVSALILLLSVSLYLWKGRALVQSLESLR